MSINRGRSRHNRRIIIVSMQKERKMKHLLIPTILTSLIFGQFSLELSADTSDYYQNQDISVSLELSNLSDDSVCIVYPGSMPYTIGLDSLYLWGGGGLAVLLPDEFPPNSSTKWEFLYDDLLTIGSHTFSAQIEFYPYCDSTTSMTYVYSENLEINIIENLGTTHSIPVDYNLFNSYPNPFNSSVKIEYALQNESKVSINIYSLNGKLVKSLLNETQTSGTKYLNWNGYDDVGNLASSGIYIAILEVNNAAITRKLTLLK